MTVRELIEHLKTLDQDKGIWVEYDMCCAFPPIPDSTFEPREIEVDEEYRKNGVKAGDYKIIAG